MATDWIELDAVYPYNHRDLVLREGDLAVLRTTMGHLCGYCAFLDDEIPEGWHGNYDAPGLQLLAIHGGLTYAERKAPHSIFGFDCAHAGDEGRPELRDPEHVMGLARQMREQMIAFANYQDAWNAADREGKCAILDTVRAMADKPVEMGFGGMLEMLSGAPSLGEPA